MLKRLIKWLCRNREIKKKVFHYDPESEITLHATDFRMDDVVYAHPAEFKIHRIKVMKDFKLMDEISEEKVNHENR